MNVRKFSDCSLQFQWWFKVLEKTLIWFKKVSSVIKLRKSDNKSFLESRFAINWTCKILLHKNSYICTFNEIGLLYIFHKDLRNPLVRYKMSKNYVSRTLGRVNTKNLFSQTVWKFSVWSLHFQWWFQFLKKTLISFKKLTSAKKLPINNDESVLESIFDLNWTCKIELTQNRWLSNFNATDLLYIFLQY